ncbi:hypothetical protein WA1_50155 [Scytonema hofmannii PCC 7110]|uniref:Uncharacterized protein n=2 Tax=Scytonema hofmannii TaxID=34078 RepID=A0A139WR36_9CYAN|nr:hypothetical protein WA1_50155 [Scytonema hofmannii PCC 7110]
MNERIVSQSEVSQDSVVEQMWSCDPMLMTYLSERFNHSSLTELILESVAAFWKPFALRHMGVASTDTTIALRQSLVLMSSQIELISKEFSPLVFSLWESNSTNALPFQDECCADFSNNGVDIYKPTVCELQTTNTEFGAREAFLG